MKQVLTFLAAALLSTAVYAETVSSCDQMVPFGYPTLKVEKDTTPLCRIAYFVLHDNARKVPLYSAELLLKKNSAGTNKRINAFKADPDLDIGKRSELTDYNKSYDRGHMTPFEDAKYNSAAALQTFYLSNMVPQNLHLNRGLWRAIENRTRSYAAKSIEGVYVITGPVFEGPNKTIGDGVAVPSSVFKVLIDKDNLQGVAYLVPNRGPKKGENPEMFKVPISDVENITGLNFTPMLKKPIFKNTIGAEFK